ncbi:MAG: response regulator transcription factor [Clostridia bacterium]|jgi:two-component system alkaline phosphatase synthesis response regulator PhoP|nr:response regulator transcription factor [Clostridia bacterium]
MIYLLEDDSSIRELIIYTLRKSDIDAKGFEKPSDFWKDFEHTKPDMVILDIMLPEESGLSILKKLRQKNEDMPIMMLTAKDSEYDKVIGLDAGADDYITKPFGMMELVSRIKALLRRTSAGKSTGALQVGSLQLSEGEHWVKANGKNIVLTLKEFELLHLLMKNQGTVFNRDQILTTVWGYEFNGESRTVDVHVRTLRQKLGKSGSLIETVRGVGYKIGGDSYD